MDPKITDKEYYINGFDDRMVTQASTKDAVKLLNKWYNMDLMWKDFALYGSGDTTEDDMIKAGYVGAFQHNQIYDNAVVAAEADFDSTWEGYMADYLSAGGQAIMDERAEKWTEYFGDADMLP